MKSSVALLLSSATVTAAAEAPLLPLDAFCPSCVWENQHYDCNHRVEWLVETYGMSEEGAKFDALSKGECVDPEYVAPISTVQVKEVEEQQPPPSAEDASEEDPSSLATEEAVEATPAESPHSEGSGASTVKEQQPSSSNIEKAEGPTAYESAESEDAISPATEEAEQPSSTTVAQPTAGEPTLSLDAFCGECRWNGMAFDCNRRVKYLVVNYHYSEKAAVWDTLTKGECVDPAYKHSERDPSAKQQNPGQSASSLSSGMLSPIMEKEMAEVREAVKQYPAGAASLDTHCSGIDCQQNDSQHDFFGLFIGIVAAAACVLWLYANRQRWKQGGKGCLVSEDEEAQLVHSMRETEASLT